MLVLVCVAHACFCFTFTLLKARRGLQRENGPRSVSLRGVWLRVVLVNFGISKNISKNQQMNPKFPGEDFLKQKKIVWLRTVLTCAESLTVFREYLRENEIFSKTILTCLSGDQMCLIH